MMMPLLARIFGKKEAVEHFGDLVVTQYRFLGKVYFWSK
jgi:hypothetical protein